ncbi:FAD:protein FMN transferase [Shimia thalassica]|uniref:FAD:protein FMN transferase n=1 Tax=Shimia thalassica TaxID=1715693 RepID=UPI0027343D94|nr:FAD:protein FMN transferase [Shimia thalassica]MDP2578315.1 FAD:protein FMN transferase [Shimia thalassica]
MSLLNRRRFLTIAAASAVVPVGARASQPTVWSGRAMGAGVSMQLVGVDETRSAMVFQKVENELERLENIFSLFRTESEISRLNRDGVLRFPSPDLLAVLGLAGTVHRASAGRFDPTIQPVWQALAEGRPVEEVTDKIGWSRLRFDAGIVEIEGALTLNGIAQGAITDRIVALLRSLGLRDVLVDMGEIAALGHRADGHPWAVGVADPDARIVARLNLSNRAVATSAPRATLVGAGQGHILSPAGATTMHNLVSISAPHAALADALSTAACLMSAHEIAGMLAKFSGTKLEVLA